MLRVAQWSSCKRISVRRSSLLTQLSSEPAASEDTNPDFNKQFRISIPSTLDLERRDHFEKLLHSHRERLRKAYNMQDSPEVALTLTLPRNYQFVPSAIEKEKEKEKEREKEKEKEKDNKAGNGKNPKSKAKSKADSQKRTRGGWVLGAFTRKLQIQYDAQRDHIVAALKSYVDVCMHAGQYECALQAVTYYRWHLKKMNQRFSIENPKPFPVEIYNQMLSGCAVAGDFKLAMDIKKILIWDNVAMSPTSYAYLLATATGKSEILDLMKEMSTAKIKLEDLFRDTPFTEEQLKKLVNNIRSCGDNRDFKIPPISFAKNETCKLVANLDKVRVPFEREERLLDGEFLRKQTKEQQNRELAGIVSIKSVAATEKPTERVLFLRKQIQKLENEWRKELRRLFQAHLQTATSQALHLHVMSVYPFLLSLDRSIFIELLVQEMRSHALASDSFSMGFSFLAVTLGRKVEALYNVQAKKNRGTLNVLEQVYDEFLGVFDPRHTTPSRELWQSLITKNSHIAPCLENYRVCPWPRSTAVIVGRSLYEIIRQLKVDVNILQPNSEKKEMMNALYSVYRTNQERTKEELRAHKVLSTLYCRAEIEDLQFETTQIPMLCPPKPWCNLRSTPFLFLEKALVRAFGECGDDQVNLMTQLPPQVLHPPLDALNVLSRTPWRVNKPVLDILTTIFLGEGDKKLDVPKNPNKMVQPDLAALKSKSKAAARYGSMVFKREKAETYALWCDLLYKLSIAHHFKDDVFWFPHNMDFRGRVYPCPPHFHHLGGDIIRGLLMFAEGRPIGPSGLRWLKLHLINLTGFLKREPIEKRVEYAEEHLDDILDSADNPLTGRKWWQTSDDPWQTLAACKELANALRSPDPSEYICHLPIHQDGSCNGLQHYAALGRDLEGATQVNLSPMDTPQDVYSGVADVVESQREQDSQSGKAIAKTLAGHIKRKVVKQTVMTVVYGVTRYGARLQILRQLQDSNLSQRDASAGASYLVDKTFVSLKLMFKATRDIQDWLTRCARVICVATGQPVRWTTPLGLPVVQPYFNVTSHKTLITSSASRSSLIHNNDPHLMKQRNGFPPNFVHSLDSSHMMLTAMNAEAAGINFVSVHDCFWTHIDSVDLMNKICREQFVALHSEPIMENLAKEFQRTYCHPNAVKLENPLAVTAQNELRALLKGVPAKGEFDLNNVIKSTYFFS